MKKILQTKSVKIAITVLVLVLFMAHLLPEQSVFAAARANVSDGNRFVNDLSSRNMASNSSRSTEKFTIVYHPNGGRGQTYEDSVDAGAEYAIKDRGYTRDYYTFRIWNTKPDGYGINYSNDEIINVTENITLYATWGRRM